MEWLAVQGTSDKEQQKYTWELKLFCCFQDHLLPFYLGNKIEENIFWVVMEFVLFLWDISMWGDIEWWSFSFFKNTN